MSFIRIIEPEQARDELAKSYRRLGAPPARVDGVVRVHSLRPHTLDAHMSLYRSILHHRANRVPADLAEAIGVRVSRINGCGYCVEHHARGLRRILADDAVAGAWLDALHHGRFEDAFEPRLIEALRYAERLTRSPAAVTVDDVHRLRAAGWSDGCILEINQLAAYFAYANRTVLGLGVEREDD